MSGHQNIHIALPAQRGKSWRVRWRIAGSTNRPQQTFTSKSAAKNFYIRLSAAYDRGERFDESTGLPESWSSGATISVAEYGRDWFMQRWEGKAAKTRTSDAEMLVDVVEATLVRDAPENADVRRWVRTVVCARPAKKSSKEQPPAAELDADLARAETHVDRWSPKLAALTNDDARDLWDRLGQKMDGKPAAASTSTRRRMLANRFLDDAVRQGKLTKNPLRDIGGHQRLPSGEVDAHRLPTPVEARELINSIASMSPYGKRARAYLLTLLLAGCRPSEAVSLISADIRPTGDGWSEITFHAAKPQSTSQFTDDGDTFDTRDLLKWRKEGHVRRVPIPPELVDAIDDHIAEFGTAPDGRIFATSTGKPITSALSPRWRVQVADKWPAGDELHDLRPYDLRHIHATALIEEGLQPGRIAMRLGHSVPELMKTYAGVFAREDDVERQRIQQALD